MRMQRKLQKGFLEIPLQHLALQKERDLLPKSILRRSPPTLIY